MPLRHTRSVAFASGLIATLALLLPARASINLFPPGQEWHPGTDGAFAPTANVEIDLSQALTGVWDQDNTANSGKGVYDPSKWAVVFKYSSVNIPAGVAVTFKNHAARAPVVWLVQGNAVVAGTVSLDSKPGPNTYILQEPGPGGFRGGSYYPRSAGFGPGGAGFGMFGGSYASLGQSSAGPTYGNAAIVPLIGGSGGTDPYSRPTSSAGGALLLASSGTITLNGLLSASSVGDYSSGSGGAIRLIAQTLVGGTQGNLLAYGQAGGTGRIRVECSSGSYAGSASPQPSYSVPSDPPVIWPPATLPAIRLTKVGTRDVSADPRAELSFPNQDVGLQTAAPLAVRMEATSVPVDGTWKVYLRVVPRAGQDFTVDAVKVSGDATSSVWETTINAPQGFSALQGRAYKQ